MTGLKGDKWLDTILLQLEGYGIDLALFFNDGYLDLFDFRSDPDFRSMKNLHERIFNDSTKSKRKNDYLAAHPEKCVLVF